MLNNDTIAAIATAPGTGGMGSLGFQVKKQKKSLGASSVNWRQKEWQECERLQTQPETR